MKRFNPSEIEPKWQKIWEEQKTYKADDNSQKPKYYALSMFPYPSGLGLHIGHVRNFTITDVVARFMRMQGSEVMQPFGWDSFGLPAENYAIKTGIPPQIVTKQNTDNFRRQLKAMGYSVDWDREFASTDPEYYKWTQWFFLLLYKRGLAYQKESAQFWCDECKTVLANEQVVNGCCWRHEDKLVTKKFLKQWFFKITDYADRLEADLADLDWPEGIKAMQRNWIGRSSGAEVDFKVADQSNFVLLHGYNGSSKRNFFPWVKEQLVGAEATVSVPDLPNADKPDAKQQASYVLNSESFDENTVLLGHSYGAVAALRIAEQLKAPIKKLVLVCGFAQPGFSDRERNFEETTDWLFDFDKIKQNVKEVVMLRPKNDSAVPKERAKFLQSKLDGKIVDFTAEQDHASGDREPVILENLINGIKIFTTRADTLFGATFIVLAPENKLVEQIATAEHKADVDMYIKAAEAKTDVDRMDENRRKTGVFTGAYAINPVNGNKLPIWVADYVLGGYGTGAIMAVPAHDQRDHDFAKRFNLPITEVIEPELGNPQQDPEFRRSIVAILRNPRTNEFLSINWGNKLGGNLFVGGGCDDNESLEETAKREIIEETGYKNVNFVAKTGRIHHHYFAYSKNVARKLDAYALLFDLIDEEKTSTSLEADEKGKFSVEWLPQAEVEQKIKEELHVTAYKILVKGECYSGEGRMVNSGKYNNLPSSQTREEIIVDLSAQKVGKERINYKIRDWLISRQRYWGAPIPIIHCQACGVVPVPDDQLPVELPDLKDFAPSGDGRSPLAKVEDWVNTNCPKCSGPAKRETDTMDGFACSSWYFLRFADPRNNKQAFSRELVEQWLPVDAYVGGAEHAVMHLLYARMWTKVMFDEGLISFEEPFKALRNQGMLLAADGTKFSKSAGNGVDPEDIISSGYGADALRTVILFLAPYDQKTPWSPETLAGVHRFLNRIWTLAQEVDEQATGEDPGTDVKRAVHKAIQKVTRDMHEMGYNTAISTLMELVNALYKLRQSSPLQKNGQTWRWAIKTIAQLAAPFAPHLAEELWQQFGGQNSVHLSPWPEHDDGMLVEETVTIVVQVNGKVRANLQVPADASEDLVKKMAIQEPNVQHFTNGSQPKRVVYVPGRLLNIVV